MPRNSADIILHNANIVTIDHSQPRARLIAIKGNKILAVESRDTPEKYSGRGTQLIDCGGKTIIPGFNDAHCHVAGLAATLSYVDCSKAGSIAEIQKAVREKATDTPPGNWVQASGYDEFYLVEKRHPSCRDLDKATVDHPVMLLHRTGHATVLNTLAMQQLGISSETPEPPGAVIERDLTTGEPDGLFFEMGAYLKNMLPACTDEEFARYIASTNQIYITQGITSLQDATVTNTLQRWNLFQRLKAEGKLLSRLSFMVGIDELPRLLGQGLAQSEDDCSRISAIKVVITQSTGAIHPSQKELNEQVLQAQRAGFPVAIHAIEESSLEAAINALEFAGPQYPGCKRPRHRIEHASECSPRLLERLKAIRPVIVSQPPFLYYNGKKYLKEISPDLQPWLYRFRSFWDNGLCLAAGSDSPVVPGNPLIGIYAAVTRKTETGEKVGAGEELNIDQALTAYTLNGAFASGEEKIKGSISAGKLADMIVLSDDPTSVEPEALKHIRVDMTILDGKIVWQR